MRDMFERLCRIDLAQPPKRAFDGGLLRGFAALNLKPAAPKL